MTPAIKLIEARRVAHTIHQYQHDPSVDSYGEEACQALGLNASRVFKTLVTELSNGDLAVAVIPVNCQLSMKSMAKALNAKKAAMADPAAVQRSSGYVLGGVSPLGQKKQLATLIDQSAQTFDTIFVSAGKRGLEIEITANDLAALVGAQFANISS